MNYTSVGALKQILSYSPAKNKNNSNNNISSSSFCSIVKIPSTFLHMVNVEEYYHLEIVCNDGTEYKIQAYREEAKALYKEVNEFDISNNITKLEENQLEEERAEEKKFRSQRKEIDHIINFTFDSTNGYSLIFKKLNDVCISKKKKEER